MYAHFVQVRRLGGEVDQDQMPAGVDVAKRLERFVQIFGAGNDADRLAVFQQKLQLALLVENVHRHHDAAGFQNAKIGQHELGNVRQHEQHLLAPVQTHLRERTGHAIGQCLDFRIGQLAIVGDHGGSLGNALGVLAEHDGQIQHGTRLLNLAWAGGGASLR